jgi:hypothetical protein
MFITKIDGETGPWTVQDAKNALHTLNGTFCTELILSDDDDSHMMFVAGGGGRYLVEIRTADRSMSLINPAGSADQPVTFVAAGQNVTCSDREAVDLELATKAVRYFARYGGADPKLTWRG